MLKRKLYIFHYHLHNGGVKSVIDQMVVLLKEHFDITVVSSSESRESYNTITFSELGYASDFTTNRFKETEANIYEFLCSLITNESDIFLFHNYHLGKNIAYTSAVIRFADSVVNRTIFYLHDFPEDNRETNYTLLKSIATFKTQNGFTLYPKKKNIRYVTINRRDNELLTNAGLPATFIHNPVKKMDDVSISKDDYFQYIKTIGREHRLKFDFTKKTLLYPVRSIRRKNIIEAILIAQILDFNIITTLPGESEHEVAYSGIVASFNGNVNGIFNLSKEYENFFRYCYAYCDYVISTSTQEGSGLFYYESIENRKPCIYREIEGILPLTDYSYKQLRVHTLKEHRDEFGDSIDFCKLPAEIQSCYLNRLDRVNHEDATRIKNILRRDQGPLVSTEKERYLDMFLRVVDEDTKGDSLYRDVDTIVWEFFNAHV